jgi:DNA replication and repair protein RecF
LKFISSFFRFSILKGVTLQQEYRYFMILNKLSVVSFKNIRTASLDFSRKLNCLIGSNGMGTTNILDAVYYLSFCRSAFTPVDSQVITHGEEFMVLEGNYSSDNGDIENIYCGMKKGNRKHFKRNKKEYKRLSQHIGLIPIIFISPADSTLIDGSSEERRRLMDMVIAQYDNAYMDHLSAYNKALQQRNALLKMEEEPDITLMEIWENQMAEAGEAVYRKRDAFIKELVPVFQNIYSSIAGIQEEVSLKYVSHCQRGPLLEIIQRDRFKDRAVGYSLHGIHRDDLEMLLGGFQMRREGSQGQTKTFSLALKLAQFNFLCRTNSATTPILLLDDIFDKLDAQRVKKIVQLVADDHYGQIFITDTNREHLDNILMHTALDYKIFEVIDGDIRQKME